MSTGVVWRDIDRIKQAALREGYELAHSDESLGKHYLGLVILVKMSNRVLCKKDSFYRVADEIKDNLDKVSAELDPEGPAKREQHRAEIALIYSRAGVEAIYMEAMPNGYCEKPCCLNRPWFRVTSKIGHIVIGWRKRVISIDWKDTSIKIGGEVVFPDENVTGWETGIHAWGVEAAVKYVRALHELSGSAVESSVDVNTARDGRE